MIARHFRAGDCMDAEGRATQEAKAEEAKAKVGSLCSINDRLSTKITQRGREKWISGDAPHYVQTFPVDTWFNRLMFWISSQAYYFMARGVPSIIYPLLARSAAVRLLWAHESNNPCILGPFSASHHAHKKALQNFLSYLICAAALASINPYLCRSR